MLLPVLMGLALPLVVPLDADLPAIAPLGGAGPDGLPADGLLPPLPLQLDAVDQAVEPVQPDERTPMSRLAPVAVVAAAAPVLAPALSWFFAGVVPLYSRLGRSEVAGQATRQGILDAIQENPGLSLKEIQTRLDLGWGTTQYHVQRLEQAELVVTKRQGHARRAYPVGEVSRAEIQAIGVLQNETARKVTMAVMGRPGTTQSEIADALGVGVPLVNKWVQRLESSGVLQRQRQGPCVRLYPSVGTDPATG